MKKRDKFWIDRILLIIAVIFVFIGISLYNIVNFNGSYITEEKSELNIFRQQIEWAVTPILESR